MFMTKNNESLVRLWTMNVLGSIKMTSSYEGLLSEQYCEHNFL